MQASVTIGGIEVALATPPGTLEGAVAHHYAAFLGRIESPVCSVRLEANRQDTAPSEPARSLVERLGSTEFRVAQSSFYGILDLAGESVIGISPNPSAVDSLLGLLFGLLAPSHDALLLRTIGLVEEDGVHVYLGSTEAPANPRHLRDELQMTEGLVMVRREVGGWLAASTPFWAPSELSKTVRESRLSRLWFLGEGPRQARPHSEVAENIVGRRMFHVTSDGQIRAQLAALAGDLARDVPLSLVRLESQEVYSWDRSRRSPSGLPVR